QRTDGDEEAEQKRSPHISRHFPGITMTRGIWFPVPAHHATTRAASARPAEEKRPQRTQRTRSSAEGSLTKDAARSAVACRRRGEQKVWIMAGVLLRTTFDMQVFTCISCRRLPGPWTPTWSSRRSPTAAAGCCSTASTRTTDRR